MGIPRKTEAFACTAKEVSTSPLSGVLALNILLRSELIRRPVAIAHTTAVKHVTGKRWWQKIKIMSQT